jgi:hypothetical protein
VVFAACGGGEDSTSSSSSPPSSTATTSGTTTRAYPARASTIATVSAGITKAQFVARANQICRRGWRKVLQNFSEFSSWQSHKLSREELFEKSVRLSFLPGLNFLVFDDLHGLPVPASQKSRAEEVVSEMLVANERGQEVVDVSTPAELSALFAGYNRTARQYGLESCLVNSARLAKALSYKKAS